MNELENYIKDRINYYANERLKSYEVVEDVKSTTWEKEQARQSIGQCRTVITEMQVLLNRVKNK